MNIENEIKVSVCVVTYNQENYIAECLESLVNQVTSFKFEIIVGEDCSTDSTRAIVQNYAEKYPDLIVPVFYKENVGAVENIKQVYKKARGKYIAHMDGDDLALPYKLQMQFDVLESHQNCNVCSHDMVRIDSLGRPKRFNWIYSEGIYSLFDLYEKLPFFAHSSKMFRNKYSNQYWDNLLNKPYILDIDVHVSNAEDGDIYHIGQFLGKYRIDIGVSISNQKINPILPLGIKRVFEKGFLLFKNQPKKIEELKKKYALSMLQCAYNYAIYNKDPDLFKEYVDLSISVRYIGLKQYIFKFATFFPGIFFKLFQLRSKLNNQ